MIRAASLAALFFVSRSNNTMKKDKQAKMMKTKTLMTLVAASALATAAFADEAFDALKALANTPTAQITAANAESILDAGLVVTNAGVMWRITDAKAMAFSDIFAKAKGKPEFFNGVIYATEKLGTEADRTLAFADFIDTWVTLDAETQQKYSPLFVSWCISTVASKKYMPAADIDGAIGKVKASSTPMKAQVIGAMLYIYSTPYWRGRLDELCEREFELVKAGVLSGEVNKWVAFDLVNYCAVTRRDDITLRAQLLNNIKWYADAGTSEKYKCAYLSGVYKNLEPTLTALRKQYLETIASNDFQLLTVAKAQDLTDGNKKTTASIFSKLTKPDSKIDTALYLGDNDKLIDAAMTIDDSVSAERLDKIIVVLTSLDPDYRAADVVKALRVINKKYTLKLYEDRDTWEPILSKVRALIEIYNS